MDILIIVLLVINMAILVFVLLKLPKADKNAGNRDFSKELAFLQQENDHFEAKLINLLKYQDDKLSQKLDMQSNFSRERMEKLEMTVRALTTESEQRGNALKRSLDESMRAMMESNDTKLSEMRQTVDEKLSETLETRLNKAYETINATLEGVYKSVGEMKTLAGGVTDLKRVLSNIKTRGVWGEVQLNALLEQILSASQYDVNVLINPSTSERVEFALKLPGKDDETVYLAIDSKFPLEQYQRLADASQNADKELVDKYSKELATAVKEQAKKISSKYILPPVTTDFAIMYLPLESLYAEVLKYAGLMEVLQRDYRVVICGPTTLGAFLNSLQLGFKTVAIEKRGTELWKLLSIFKVQFRRFTDVLEKSQKKIDEASKTLEEATKRTLTIQKKLGSVEDIADIDAEKYMAEID